MAKREMLHMDFASQLESMGLWHWSIFVLLHLKDPYKRAKLAKDVLSRNVMPSDDESVQREEFLQERLGVPLAWIADAKAVRAATESNYGDQVIVWNYSLISRHFQKILYGVQWCSFEIRKSPFYAQNVFRTHRHQV